MNALLLVGGGVMVAALLVGAVAWLAYRNGRDTERHITEVAAMEVKDVQLDAAVHRPDTRDELVDRLRRPDF